LQHAPDVEHNKRVNELKSVAIAGAVKLLVLYVSANCRLVACGIKLAPTVGRQPRSPGTRPAGGCLRPPIVAGNIHDAIVVVATCIIYFFEKNFK